MAIGRTRQRLAKLLQASFPTNVAGQALTWDAEHIYPATGAYRSSGGIDCARWSASARHVRADGTFFTAATVASYSTMTALVRFKYLFASDVTGEIGGTNDDPEASSEDLLPMSPGAA